MQRLSVVSLLVNMLSSVQGSVVTRDVPDYALVYGNPAKQHGWMCQCGARLELTDNFAQCGHCHRKYQCRDNQLTSAGY